ncbi:HTTM domain-containing protein [Streptomyces boninensis]|uniref:HTTM domain-containing protein n=1 Tax=Streptomyces boninensis TaxID=2039455 RepID=UPI003B20C8D8
MKLLDRASGTAYSLRSAAVLRIGTGVLALAYLLRDAGDAAVLWGPDAYWTPEMAYELNALNGWTGFYTIAATDSAVLWWTLYGLAIVVSVLFTLGWRTRVTAVVFAVLMCAVQFRTAFVNDSGDHVIRLLAIYLACTACGRVWSLDARREWSPPLLRGENEELRRRVVTLTHNLALLVIGGQVMIAYGAAAMYKIQGATWRDGTALHYALHLNAFTPWPELSHWVAGQSVLILALAYLTVFTQLGLPLAVFSRVLKYPFLIALLGSHAAIAVLMGLPLFSAAMVIGDVVFLGDAFWIGAAVLMKRGSGGSAPGPRQRGEAAVLSRPTSG